jgi:predicted transcriptional regulator of viral defense system
MILPRAKPNLNSHMPNRSTKKSLLLSKLEKSGIEIFSLSQVTSMLNISPAAASKVVHELSVEGRLRRIQKSTYIVVPTGYKPETYTLPATLIASALIKPYYLSYWTALHFYGWTEQPSRTVFVATTKLKKPVTVSGVTFKFVNLRPQRFFGYTSSNLDGRKVIIADPEKTIVDSLDQPRYCGEIVEVTKGLWNGRRDFDFDKMRRYALRMENRAIVKRLGYLMEKLDIGTGHFRESLKAAKSSGYAPLDTGVRGKGTYNNDWNLFVNVSEYNLTEWIKH